MERESTQARSSAGILGLAIPGGAALGLAMLLFGANCDRSPSHPGTANGGEAGYVTGPGGFGGETGGMTGMAGASGRVPLEHRAAAVACAMDRPAGACSWASMPDAAVQMCLQDSDCTAGSNGRCNDMPRLSGCHCSYDQCFADADCATGSGPCECRAAANTAGQSSPGLSATNVCKAGNCRVDKDCAGGTGYCSPSLGSCGNWGGVVGYYCHTPQDKCIDDADCAAQGGGDCRFDAVGAAWQCETSQCAG